MRVGQKLKSINYKPGLILPQEIYPWYIVITEIRLHFLAPLVIIRLSDKTISNILPNELSIISFVKNRTKEFQYVFDNGSVEVDGQKISNVNIAPPNFSKIDLKKVQFVYTIKWGNNMSIEIYTKENYNEDFLVKQHEIISQKITLHKKAKCCRNAELSKAFFHYLSLRLNSILTSKLPQMEDKLSESTQLVPLFKNKEYLLQTINLNLSKPKNDLTEDKDKIQSIIEEFENSFFFSEFSKFFDNICMHIKTRIEMETKSLQNEIERTEIYLNAYDADGKYTFIPTRGLYYNKILSLDDFISFVGLSIDTRDTRKQQDIVGMVEYIYNTLFPDFILDVDINDEDLKNNPGYLKKFVENYQIFSKNLRLIDKQPISFFQVPVTYVKKKGKNNTSYFPVYILTLFFQIGKDVPKSERNILSRKIMSLFFDLCGEITFASTFIQSLQKEIVRSNLFEEATESFKKAMRFPLSEESEEKKNEKRR